MDKAEYEYEYENEIECIIQEQNKGGQAGRKQNTSTPQTLEKQKQGTARKSN